MSGAEQGVIVTVVSPVTAPAGKLKTTRPSVVDTVLVAAVTVNWPVSAAGVEVGVGVGVAVGVGLGVGDGVGVGVTVGVAFGVGDGVGEGVGVAATAVKLSSSALPP